MALRFALVCMHAWCNMRFGSTTKVLAKRMPMYNRIFCAVIPCGIPAMARVLHAWAACWKQFRTVAHSSNVIIAACARNRCMREQFSLYMHSHPGSITASVEVWIPILHYLQESQARITEQERCLVCLTGMLNAPDYAQCWVMLLAWMAPSYLSVTSSGGECCNGPWTS